MPQRHLASRGTMGGAVTARLTNGMRLIVMEDRRSPVAVCNLWVRVGSNLEPDGVRGWAHGIEHLLFKGTQRRAEGDFAREVADLGGTTNAGTGYETTNYHITVPAEHLPAAVDILHDALFHSEFEPAALDAERKVLVHENHMYDDQPSGFGVT
ncbi:MAG: pitrilysin family protein, partial [bacterium]|nr:pitrilysin family protein [bacterium]